MAENTAAVKETVEHVPEWTLGDRLRKARMDAGLEQDEMTALLIAGQIKATRASVSSWERDTARPRDLMRVVNKWSDITKVPAWWLFGIRSTMGYKQTPPAPRLYAVR